MREARWRRKGLVNTEPQNRWRKLRTSLSEKITDSAATSELVGHAHLIKGTLPFQPDAQRLNSLLKAARWINLSASRLWLRYLFKPYVTGSKTDLARNERVGWQRYYGDFGRIAKQKALTTSLVLKAPGPRGEKGVLYSSFEYNWMRLLAHHDARAILNEYYLVGATSGARNDYASMIGFAGLSPDPIFIGVSNLAQVEPLCVLRPVIEPLPILASDWINPDHFKPKPHRDRTIDILMVAAWPRLKRHWLLFEALRNMPKHLRVVLVGRDGPGRHEREIRAEARQFGVRQDLEFHTNLEIDEVYALQCDARISAVFTRREGSCVAVPESLFAGSPVAMMQDAFIGSKAYINPQTGVLVRRHGLARQLQEFLEQSARYTARQWATDNISCKRTSARLNEMLKWWSLNSGRPWTTDIAPMCWRYVPSYVDLSDKLRLAPAVEHLANQYGLTLQEFPGERAAKAMSVAAEVYQTGVA